MDHQLQEELPVVVVMVPLPEQSHLNQHLNLSRLISTSAGLPVYFTGSATHNRQAKSRLQGWDPSTTPNIHFHDLPPLPPSPTPLLFRYNSANKPPSHTQHTLAQVLLHHPAPLSKLLSSLSSTSKRVIVIHDFFMLYAAKEASLIPKCEAYLLNNSSIFFLLVQNWLMLGKPITEKTQNLVTKFPSYRAINDGSIDSSMEQFIYSQMEFLKFVSGNLYNTSEALEGKFLELFDQEEYTTYSRGSHWVIGPFNPITVSNTTAPEEISLNVTRHDCLEWLGKQPAKSVMYVAFGTTVWFSDEEIKELAIGLESSGQRFIWVLRTADPADIFTGEEAKTYELPKGYEERLNKRGIILKGSYAPQLDILAHKSIGGFMSHCGWNSCIESLSFGVPLAAWPMHSDQPWNSWLVTKVLKVGFLVREWEKKEELVSSTVIASITSKLIESSEGNEVRERAEELGAKIRQSVMDGGTSMRQLDAFFKHITRAQLKL